MDFKVSFVSGRMLIKLQGVCDYSLDKKSKDFLSKLINANERMTLDFLEVTKVDFVFCAFIYGLLEGKDYEILNADTQVKEIFQSVVESLPKLENSKPKSHSMFYGALLDFGKFCERFYQSSLDFLNFCGMCLFYFFRSCGNLRHFKLGSIMYHINESGFKALPVALFTAFIVSYAIALQGVLQLEKMGVPLMSVEIVAKLSLREMGPFILAIVIAGRSSSSFAAQIGVMNLTEENDALKTMNLSLFDYIILPRILALVIIMPLLVFLADAVSLFACFLAINMQTGLDFMQYLERFYEYVSIENFWVGVIKAPFFGAAVALVGCFRGLYVKGDTESVGIETTKSVVNAIFWVILINAIFSIITTGLNI
ncbi:ABC transporter permease [Helicobacter cinaedi]|uniref:MlaE family ABC transporter permease n=1 Tax=Helicobacter cinaedi TaxID=213 RepID=UPI001F387C15|nr:MlaE family lipid ABC transporter permease subunit [Helicobacter cinaedi]BDB65680.1 ABC transporter permease [Helicobacter cinaedi]